VRALNNLGGDMKLSKRVPSRTKTVEFNWCKKEFTTMTDRYREIRGKSRNPMTSCFWCQHAFENGETIALAQPKKGGNKALCQTCADVVIASQESE